MVVRCFHITAVAPIDVLDSEEAPHLLHRLRESFLLYRVLHLGFPADAHAFWPNCVSKELDLVAEEEALFTFSLIPVFLRR